MALQSRTESLRLIDIPGHPRIRDQFQEYLPHAKAIAFVVDASTVSRNGPAVAEYVTVSLIVCFGLTCSTKTSTYDPSRPDVFATFT